MAWNYQQAQAYIQSFDDPYLAALRNRTRQTWGLESISRLLHSLGEPQRTVKVIHVAGTKGKGSTSAMIAAGLSASGFRVGLYTSPHLVDWRERIQINQHMIQSDDLTALTLAVKPHAESIENLTSFELGTALAFWHFAKQGCEVAVIEVGLGGRLDATNVVQPAVSVITSISHDHMQFLGDTLGSIAAEKAAIIKPGCIVVSAPQSAEALAAIERRVHEADVPLTLVGRDWQYETLSQTLDGSEALIGRPGDLRPVSVGLAGAFQIENAAVALAALDAAHQSGIDVSEMAARQSMATVRWPGRFEVVSREPLMILDGAHNGYSVQKLLESTQAIVGSKPPVVIFGCMADKDLDSMLQSILQVARILVLTQTGVERAALASDLAARIARLNVAQRPESIHVTESMVEALTLVQSLQSPSDYLLVTGSLALVGEAKQVLASLQRAS
jgi:dihydrofolate synthase/folylpolyglutamate synthase